MLLNRGNLNLDNDAIITKCYEFLNEHTLVDTNENYGQLNGKLSSVLMARYLEKNKLRHLMPHHWPELKSLVDIIKEQSNSEDVESSWFNILPHATSITAHAHILSKTRGAKYGSFVYYPKVINDDSYIELLINDKWVSVWVSTGTWISFDLDCLHRVPTNNTEHHRISIAFNV
jgi:hypothetical protein